MNHKKIKKVFVEIAKTPSQLNKGLMFRDKLEDDSGMMFVFDKPKILSFWGMNTFIPLDIAFIDDSGIIKDIKRIKKHDLNSVKSSCPCKYALEIDDGWFSKNGFNEGDYVDLSFMDKSSHIAILKNLKLAQKQEDSLFSENDIDTDEKASLKEKDKEQKEIVPKEEVKKPEEAKNIPVVSSPILLPPIQKEISIPKFNNVYQAIPWAFSNNQVMRITYKTEHGHTVTRDIEPHRVYFSRKSKGQVLKAFDETSAHPSQYIVRNIVSFGFPGRKFTPKSIFNKRR